MHVFVSTWSLVFVSESFIFMHEHRFKTAAFSQVLKTEFNLIKHIVLEMQSQNPLMDLMKKFETAVTFVGWQAYVITISV